MKKLASVILALALILTLVPASIAETTCRIAVICDPVGVNLFLTQVRDKVVELAGTYGYEYDILECSDTDQWASNYKAAAHEDYDLIIGVGWQAGSYAAELATDDLVETTKFAVIDTDAGSENVMSVSYNEEQAAYLIGYMAGAAFPEEEVYGYVGCFDGSGSFKYKWGFVEGVKANNPDAKFMFNFTNSYSDTAAAYEFAKQQQAAGCTYIFGGAASGNEGIFSAALELAEAGTPIYSIAQDADATTPDNPYILSAQLKNTGVSAQHIIDAYFNGTFVGGNTVENLSTDGIGATWVTADGAYRNEEILTDDVLNACKAVVEQIVSGELVLEMPEDYDSYVINTVE